MQINQRKIKRLLSNNELTQLKKFVLKNSIPAKGASSSKQRGTTGSRGAEVKRYKTTL